MTLQHPGRSDSRADATTRPELTTADPQPALAPADPHTALAPADPHTALAPAGEAVPFEPVVPDIPRTLVFTGHFPPEPGGVETFTWEIARRLPPERLVVIGPYHPDAARFDRTLGFPVIRRRGYLITRELRRIVRASGVTTAWIPAAAPFGLLAPLLRRAGVERVVASSHGQELGWIRVPPTRQALRQMSRSLDVLTYLSPFTHTHLAPIVRRPAILHQLAGGVDVSTFRPGPVESAARQALGLRGGPTVVSVSRLVPRKGHDVLLRAWPEVLRRIPDAQLVMIGVGPMRERLERAAAAPALRGSVRLTGFVPLPDLVAYLRAADVFALPCHDHRGGLQTEGLGLAALEASATGLPIVLGRSGGSVDAVIDGTTGRLIRGEDPAEVANTLIDVLEDPDRARWMGAQGRRWVCDNWTWGKSARGLAALL